MGFIATILKINKRDITIDSGGNNKITAQQYLPPGEDSLPLISDEPAKTFFDNAVATPVMQTGRAVVIGYFDNKVNQKSDHGEKRIYSRKADGSEVAEIWLKKTGEISIKNDNCEFNLSPDGVIKGNNSNGKFELQENGNFVVNDNMTVNTDGEITTPKITIGGIVFSVHVHGGVSSGGDDTGVPE